MNPKQLAAYALVAAAFTPVCWAQVTSSSEASASPQLKFQRLNVLPPRGHAAVARSSPPLSTGTPNASAGYTYNGIMYNGGPVLNSPEGVNVYIIWYGDWPEGTTQPILTGFLERLSGSPYWNIVTTYYDFKKNGEINRVNNKVNLNGSIVDAYSFGNMISDNDVGLIIQNPVTSHKLPADPNGVYFLISSPDVVETSGFCTQYCAFHGYQPVSGLNVNKGLCGDPNSGCLWAAFAGDVAQCPELCSFEGYVSGGAAPNGNLGADGTVDSISHELAESVTDPNGLGWINPDGTEMADFCDTPPAVVTLGPVRTLPDGESYNLSLGSRHYLSAERWVNALGGYCALRWDE